MWLKVGLFPSADRVRTIARIDHSQQRVKPASITRSPSCPRNENNGAARGRNASSQSSINAAFDMANASSNASIWKGGTDKPALTAPTTWEDSDNPLVTLMAAPA